MEENRERTHIHKIHVLAIPFPFQGHINPMIQFSNRLAFEGLKVTLIIFSNKKLYQSQYLSINLETISIDIEENSKNYLQQFQSMVSKELPGVIEKHKNNGFPINCVVHDSVMPWVVDITRQFGIARGLFFTQSCAVSAIFCHVHEGKLSVPVEEGIVSLPGLPALQSYELPACVYNIPYYPSTTSLLSNQFSNFKEADWIFFNSVNALEKQVLTWLTSARTIKLIGPTNPSVYLNKHVETNKDYGLSLFKQNVDGYIEWLDSKELGSVVYVSFGSIAPVADEQVAEVAWGLKRSNYCFLWAIRETEKEKLSNNFVKDASAAGLIVPWCPQPEVLAHKSVGCFVSHCGWNSTLEAISLGVPMIAIPQCADQTTNAKFIADVWQVGVRAKPDAKGVVTSQEVEFCVKEVMVGETGNRIRRNSEKWKKIAKEAVDQGGSSHKNIEEFIAELSCKLIL